MPYSFDNELGDSIRHIGAILEEVLSAHRSPARSDEREQRESDTYSRFAPDDVWARAASNGIAKR